MSGVVQATDACRSAAGSSTASVCVLISCVAEWRQETTADERLLTDVGKIWYDNNNILFHIIRLFLLQINFSVYAFWLCRIHIHPGMYMCEILLVHFRRILSSDTWRGLSANLECGSEMCYMRLAENTGCKITQKLAIYALSHNFVCLVISSQLRHLSTIGKKTC